MENKKKYLVYKNGYDILLLSVRDVLVNESIAIAPCDDIPPEREKLYFLAKIVPEKIIAMLSDDISRFTSEKKAEFFYLNEKIGYFIDDGKLFLRTYKIEKNNETGKQEPIENIDEFEITSFVDTDYNCPHLMEFDSDDCAQLYAEASRVDWENNYGRRRDR